MRGALGGHSSPFPLWSDKVGVGWVAESGDLAANGAHWCRTLKSHTRSCSESTLRGNSDDERQRLSRSCWSGCCCSKLGSGVCWRYVCRWGLGFHLGIVKAWSQRRQVYHRCYDAKMCDKLLDKGQEGHVEERGTRLLLCLDLSYESRALEARLYWDEWRGWSQREGEDGHSRARPQDL